MTGAESATVVRLLTMTLRSVVDCVKTTANVLKSMPSGWSVPVNVSVCSTGVGAVGLLLQLVTSAEQDRAKRDRRESSHGAPDH